MVNNIKFALTFDATKAINQILAILRELRKNNDK